MLFHWARILLISDQTNFGFSRRMKASKRKTSSRRLIVTVELFR